MRKRLKARKTPIMAKLLAQGATALTVTLTSILTHAFITGRVVLPPGLSNLSNIFLRILPGSDYRRTPNIEDVDSSHRSDWTWASPARA